ncbi:MAG TPA: hypothetical protein VMT20_01575 [Terriglobia bacterium]|nr:hypothetical protein [Terriglobia bacterium]
MLGRATSVIVLTAALLPVADSGNATRTIPAGVRLEFGLATKLSSKVNQTGDRFSGETEQPTPSRGTEILPVHSAVQGHVADVQRAGHPARARLQLFIDVITAPDGTTYRLPPDIHIQRLIGVREKGKWNTVSSPDQPGQNTSPGTSAAAQTQPMLFTPNYKDAVLAPGTVLTFLISQDVTAANR